MPWGPTLETDSKSESNEIWIKLVTSFWRHNGATMVPQFAPPGLYPLVRAHMSIVSYRIASHRIGISIIIIIISSSSITVVLVLVLV